MALDSSAPDQLHLRVFKHREVWTATALTDPAVFSAQLVEYFCDRLLNCWFGGIELETTYVLAARKEAPYQKKVMIRYSTGHYTEVETKLGVRITKERLEGFGSQHFTMSGEILKPTFSALLTPTAPKEEPIEFISAVHYQRFALIYPIMVNGQIWLELTFPKGYFEPIPQRGIRKVVSAPAK